MAEKIKKIAKRANQSVTTTESWASFGILVWTVWTAIGATVVAAMTAASIQVWQSALNVGWEYWVLAGIPSLFLTIIGVLWLRYFITVALIKRREKIDQTKSTVSESDIKALQDRLAALEGVNPSETVAKVVAPLMQGIDTSLQERFDTFEEKSNRGIDTLFANKKSSDAQRFGELHEILKAKTTLRRYEALTSDIEKLSSDLDKIPMSSNWDSLFLAYQSKLKEWDKFQIEYPIIVYRPLFDVMPSLLKSSEWDADVNNLPQDEGLSFKHFRVYKKAFDENKTRMHSNILDKAMKTFAGHGCNIASFELFR